MKGLQGVNEYVCLCACECVCLKEEQMRACDFVYGFKFFSLMCKHNSSEPLVIFTGH